MTANSDWTDNVAADKSIQPFDTGKATAEELRATPQHVDPVVYAHLARKAVYPMTLPFHRPLEVARAYLGHLGTSRADVLDIFGAEKGKGAALAIERLGTCPAQYQVVAAAPSATEPPLDAAEVDGLKDLWVYYGYGSAAELAELVEVPKLLHRTGLALEELVAILKTRFVNPDLYSEAAALPATKVVKIQVPADPGEDACDVSQMKLTYLDPAGDAMSAQSAQAWLDRLHRFVRLWRVLGWAVADVDRALAAVGVPPLDAKSLEKLAALEQISKMLDRPAASLISLWAKLDTWGVELEPGSPPKVTFREPSPYELAFLSRAVLPEGPEGHEVRQIFKDVLLSTSAETLDGLAPEIAAALAITEEDVHRIRKHAKLTGSNANLDLANLSALHRYATLAKALEIRVRDLLTLLRLTPDSMNPFASADPLPALEFVRTVLDVNASRFPIPLLNYLLGDEAEPTRHPAPTRVLVKTTLEGLQAGLAAIHQEMQATEQTPPDTVDVLQARLAVAGPRLDLPTSEDVERALAILDPRQTTLDEQPLTPQVRKSFANQHFTIFLPTPAAALFDQPLPDPADLKAGEDRFLENAKLVLTALVPWLRRTLQEALVVQTMADAMGVEQTIMLPLLTTVLASTDPQDHPGTALDYFLSLVDDQGARADLHLDQSPPKPPTLAVYRLFKAAAYLNGFGLSREELALFTETLSTGTSSPLRSTFGAGNSALVLDLNKLPIDGVASDPLPGQLFEIWAAIRAYCKLRESLPRSERTLVDYFGAKPSDAEAILEELTGWEKDRTDEVKQGFGWTTLPDDSRGLIRLSRAMTLLKRLGGTPDRVFAWAKKAPDHAQAEEVLQAVKARYGGARWLEVARALNDPLREKQRDALVSFLIPRLKHPSLAIKTANDLLEYFLIDVEMSSCMLTSRIKQAIASVQLFVQRCLLNLEPAVSPDEIDPERWEWMQHYRIWEANRKVFLYPENWAEPELRDDKTPFFRELETELLQNELTDETVETALVNYLYKLDEVARLDIRGFCKEEREEDGADKEIYHVFGRTWNPPYVYFYRKGIFPTDGAVAGEWTPWERVDSDIDGDHLIPVVWNRRLYLLWPTFKETPRDKADEGVPVGDESGPFNDWEIQLALSERKNTGWSAKQVAKKGLPSRHLWINEKVSNETVDHLFYPTEAAHYFKTSIEANGLAVSVFRRWSEDSNKNLYHPSNIYIVGGGGKKGAFYQLIGNFLISSCRGGITVKPQASDLPYDSLGGPQSTINDFMRFQSESGSSGLVFEDTSKTEALGSGSDFGLLAEPQIAGPSQLYYPFFFADPLRTYFARPILLRSKQPAAVVVSEISHGGPWVSEHSAVDKLLTPPYGNV